MPEPIYKIRGLSKRYGPKTVLRDLDFDVQRGESLVVSGLSGSGKSVTLRQLNGLEKPDSGSIEFEGEEISHLRERELYPLRKRVAMIKTLGLLGDNYIDISSGTTNAPVIPAGGRIPAAPPTDVDRLIATSGDVMGNVVSISYSLRHILERMEAGEGLLGELITDLRQGAGALPALLNDPRTREQLDLLLTGFEQTSQRLAGITDSIQSGDGLLSKMLNDEDYAKKLTEELQQLLRNLRLVSDRIAQSQGTLGLLISDPQVYEAMNDIIVGVDESSMLRWLVRNRQKKGIEKRYNAEQLELPQEVPATDNSTTSGGTQ